MHIPLIHVFLLGLGIALNPAAVIAIILILSGARSARTGYIFLAGWVTGLILLVVLPSLLIMEGLRRLLSTTSLLPAWAWVFIGCALLATALFSLRDRAQEIEINAQPRWAGVIANGGSGRIFGFGATLSLASLRNVILLASAVALISSASLGLPGLLIAAAIFLLASSLGVLAPLLVYLFGGDRSTSLLETSGTWMQRNLIWLKIIILVAVGAGMLAHGLRLVAQG